MLTRIYTDELNPVQLNWILVQHLNQTYGQACYDPKTKRAYQNEGLHQIGLNYSPAVMHCSRLNSMVENTQRGKPGKTLPRLAPIRNLAASSTLSEFPTTNQKA